jgi:glycosyltransferase involved in cell wall biosynthesis
MKILIVGGGGVTKIFKNWPEYALSSYFIKAGHEVISYSGLGEYPMNIPEEIINGVHVKRFRFSFHNKLPIVRSIPTWIFLRSYLTEEFDIVHMHHLENILNMFMLNCVYLKRKPMVFTSHDPFFSSNYPRLGLKRAKMYRKFCSKVDAVIALSPIEKALIVEKFDIDEEKVAVIPNGVFFEEYNKPKKLVSRDKYGIPDGATLLLFIGQLRKFKGVDYLIKAFKILCDFNKKLYLIIKTQVPILLPEYQNMARRLEINDKIVFISENLLQSDLVDLYYSCDIYVHPSLAECLSLVILEAMACGKPVVATNVGGTPYEVIDGKTGFLVKPGDARELSEKIKILTSDPELMKFMGKNGRERVRRNFTWESAGEKTLNLYRHLLA